MLGNFNPSAIVDEIYNLMDNYEVATDVFSYSLVSEITKYLEYRCHVEYLVCCSAWPNEEGGVCSVAFVDSGHPQLITFDYQY